jgi:octaprenyl-diphosphate synthase
MLLASEEGGGLAAQELARAVTEMAEGEVMQLRWAGDLSCDVSTYLQWVERKSAALISWCVAAGAWSKDDRVGARALAGFGRGVGIAFQITDDVLDYRSGTGKKAGTDLKQRKVTLPLLKAMEKDEDIRKLLEQGSPDEALTESLITRIQATGALDDALETARGLVNESTAQLEALPGGEGRDALAVLGRYLVERVS